MTVKGTLYRITFGNICAGVLVYKDIVIHAAPVLGRFIARPFEELREWVIYRRDGKITRMGNE